MAAGGDLPASGHAGAQTVVAVAGIERLLAGQHRARANQRHITFHNVQKLRQLVGRAFAENLAKGIKSFKKGLKDDDEAITDQSKDKE